MMSRKFTVAHAKRERVPMLVGLIGPSASGKTYSALRLATGMVEVTGGKIIVIDTEARRSLHYAEDFDFEHVQMDPPFSPNDYLEAIKYASSLSDHPKDAPNPDVLIIDSMSHEHEGQGGVLEMHAEESKRLAKRWRSTEDKVKFAAWIEPKRQRRELINTILQMGVNAIFCFRAKEKTKPGTGQEKVIHLGWQAVAGEEFVFEMLVNVLLYPNAGGVPTWQPDEKGENSMIKRPKQFLDGVFPPGQPLDEGVGRRLAEWASGGAVGVPRRTTPTTQRPMPSLDEAVAELQSAPDLEELMATARELAGWEWDETDRAYLKSTIVTMRTTLSGGDPPAGGGSDSPTDPSAGAGEGEGDSAPPSPTPSERPQETRSNGSGRSVADSEKSPESGNQADDPTNPEKW